jgi:hypothetical protein
MKRDKDIVALIELPKMAAEQWRHANREISQKDLFHRDRPLRGQKPAGALASAAETFLQES